MGKVIEVTPVDGFEEPKQPQPAANDIPPIEELQRMIEQRNRENIEKFAGELKDLLVKYNVDLVPRVTVEGNRIIESAVLVVNK